MDKGEPVLVLDDDDDDIPPRVSVLEWVVAAVVKSFSSSLTAAKVFGRVRLFDANSDDDDGDVGRGDASRWRRRDLATICRFRMLL